ncbi:MAG: T9SS type A sorting domain-containing protein [Paludibacter sp.]
MGTGTTMLLSGLTQSTLYTVTLKAKDQAGNLSEASASIIVQTLANGLIVYEPFNYTGGTTANDPDGGINLGNGLPATNPTGDPAGIGTGLRGKYGAESLIVGGLSYTGLQTTGAAMKVTNADWGTGVNVYKSMTTDPYISNRIGASNIGNFGIDGQTLYVSFLAQTTDATPMSFRVCVAGGRNVFIQNTATTWSLSDNGNSALVSTATLELNTPTLLVLKYQFVAGIGDVISLYKNPTIGQALGTANATLTVGGDFPGIFSFSTRPSVANAMVVDEFRLGTSPEVVMPASLSTNSVSYKIANIYSYCINKQIVTNLTEINGKSLITIYDARGRLIKSLQTSNSQLSIPVPNAGMYLVRVINGEKVFTQKVIVQ